MTEDLSTNTSWLARIQNTGKQSGAYVDYHYYGTGDQGGAPRSSSVEWIEKSIAGKGPITVVSTRADEMFTSLTEEQKAKLPKYKGELLLIEHSAGSVTSQAYMKRWNRKNEQLADAAERAAVAANLWAQTPYPYERLYTAWDLTLGSQMHDMLPGTSLPKAYEFCYNDELLSLKMFGAVTEDAVGAASSQMDTQAKGTAVVVYNPLSIAREDVVEAWVPIGRNRIVEVYGPDGKPVPTQTVVAEATRSKVIFLAKVPSSGFATFDARTFTQTEASGSSLSANGRTLESPRFRVRINEAGDIASIYDKINRREALKSPARLDFQHHNPKEYPAWNMDWNDAKLPPYAKVDGTAAIRIVESGPVRATIEVERTAQGSKFVQRISLSAGGAGDRVEVSNVIDWATKESVLKAAFPLTTENPKATYDLQVGAIERGVNDEKKYEVPQHQWFDQTASDGKYGVAILNDSKFGSDKPSDDTVRLTLLYTPGTRGGFQDQGTQDFGRHEMVYAIAPHAGDWRKGNVAWTAKRLNQPLRAFTAPSHPGRMGRSNSLLAVNSKQIEVQALKRAEDGDGFIVRLRELTGSPATNVRVEIPGVVTALEVDGQERPIAGKVMVANGAMVASVRGYGLKSYRVRLATTRIALPQPVSQSVVLKYDLDVVSSDKKMDDGSFTENASFPAEQFPKSLKLDGVSFKFGSTADGANNALVAKGQTIALPKGFDRVYLIAAAIKDATPTFTIGGKKVSASIPAWGGYIGNWDTRLWNGTPPELTFGWPLQMVGLEPGFVKKGEVAWYASHHHLAGKGNQHYAYSYLFKQGFDVPKGATSITLPLDGNVRIFAISVARNTNDKVVSAAPLFDTLDGRQLGGTPTIEAKNDPEGNGATVTVRPPLYYRSPVLYALDDGTPTPFSGPVRIVKPTKVDAMMEGASGSTTSLQVDARDAVAPKIVSASLVRELGAGSVVFSEPVDKATAENATSYSVGSARPTSAKLSSDGQRVDLVFAILPTEGDLKLAAAGVADIAGNKAAADPVTVESVAPVFVSPILEPSETAQFDSEAPRGAKDPWTLNFWLRLDKQPADRTLIAGFGRARDGQAGLGRYITKFPTGIQFWSTQRDVPTNAPFDLDRWQMLTATYDGAIVKVYKDGKLIGSKEQALDNDSSRVNVFPLDAWERQRKAEGEIRKLTIWNQALPQEALQKLYAQGRG